MRASRPVEAEILHALDSLRSAITAGDLDATMRLFAPDDDVTLKASEAGTPATGRGSSERSSQGSTPVRSGSRGNGPIRLWRLFRTPSRIHGAELRPRRWGDLPDSYRTRSDERPNQRSAW